jgi:hypothetical protein
MAFRDKIKKNRFTYKLAASIIKAVKTCKKKGLSLLYIPRKMAWSIGILLRKHDIVEFKKYSRIKLLAGTHPGERCFIVCTGPSLTVEDLDKLKNETCIGINSVINIFGSTSWRPKYIAMARHGDLNDRLAEIYQNEGLSYIIYSNTNKFIKIEDPNVLYQYPILNYVRRKNESKLPKEGKYIFSDDPYVGVTGGATTANAMLQIAVYMGFTEIYLIGADCDYGSDQKYFQSGGSDGNYNVKFDKEKIIVSEEHPIFGYEKAKEYADSHGISIFNATRGGKLEVFLRVDLDEVLNLK